ncbi:WD40-repeat-containing domain protein [Russula aff. rugulosa BPL654]|nr:WD40-repeat-containing domain protein [Russula aff. rugulosa BPL654]
MTTALEENLLRSDAELKLDLARKEKAEKYKDVGEPIVLSGAPMDIKIRGNYAWVAASSHTAHKINLQTGKTVQLYKGHSGPVTSLVFYDKISGSGDENLLITGSWDKTKTVISSTLAHSDFVKTLLVIPSLQLLVSGSSDKSVRFWSGSVLGAFAGWTYPMGSISAHTRPVESLAGYLDTSTSPPHLVLFTADTMGVIKAWDVVKDSTDGPPIWRSTLRDDLEGHRTRINEIVYGNGHLWSASADETIQMLVYPPPTHVGLKKMTPITDRKGFRAVLPIYLHPELDPDAFPYLLAGSGDCIHVYDISSLDEVELLREIEGHWHDVTHLRTWIQGSGDGARRDVWVVSGSLDGTLRRWKLSELIAPPPPQNATTVKDTRQTEKLLNLTEEEERELAELMGDDV